MKKILTVGFMVIVFTACKKQNNTATTVAVDSIPSSDTVTATAKIIQGNVQGDKANGDAQLFKNNGNLKLFLSNFSTTNGPDLHVYLATDVGAATYIDLGLVKSTSGNQVYNISGNPDIVTYKYVIIWCKQFGVYFGGGKWM